LYFLFFKHPPLPPFNQIAGNILGYKHTPESLEKMKNRVISSETKLKMSISAKERLKREDKLSPFIGKKYSEKSLALLSIAVKNRKTRQSLDLK